MPCCAPVTSATFPARRIGVPSEGGADELAAESDEPPGRALRVPAEADVGGERVLVPEQPLDGIAVVDAVGACESVQGIHRVGAELHGVGDVASAPQLVLDRHERPCSATPWASRQSARQMSRAASICAPARATRSCTAWKSRMRAAV